MDDHNQFLNGIKEYHSKTTRQNPSSLYLLLFCHNNLSQETKRWSQLWIFIKQRKMDTKLTIYYLSGINLTF